MFFIFFRTVSENKLKCAPWSRFLSFSSFELTPTSKIPIYELENMMGKIKPLILDKRFINWLQNEIISNVIIVGAPKSGKTSFIKLLQDKSQFPTQIKEETSISYKIRNFIFWDFKYQEIIKLYLGIKCQYIIVVNLYNLIHNDMNIRNESLKYTDYWIKEIKKIKNKQESPIFFLGTHCDLLETSKIKKNAINKLLQLAEANEIHFFPKIFLFFKSLKKSFLKKNTKSIMKYIQLHANECIKKELNFDNIHNVIQFLICKQRIELIKENHPFLSWKEFENLCFESSNKNSENTVLQFTELLCSSGIIETFKFKDISSEVVFLDLKILYDAYYCLLSSKISSSSNKQGFFNQNQIENSFKSQNISNCIWNDIINIFLKFRLIALLPKLGKYFIPFFLHNKEIKSNEQNTKELIINKCKENTISYHCIKRKYEFSSIIPIDMIDELIINYLQFPNFSIHSSSTKNEIYFYFKENSCKIYQNYHILIQLIENEYLLNSSDLIISIYFPKIEEDENNLNFSFFSQFLFQSLIDISNSPSFHPCYSINNIFIIDNDGNLDSSSIIEEEQNLVCNFRNYLHLQKYLFSLDIKIYDSDIHRCKFKQQIESGEYYSLWLGNISFNIENNKIKTNVIFEELKKADFINLRNLINQILILKMIENQFIIKFYGICIPSMRLLESRKFALSESGVLVHFNEEKYLNHQMLTIFEESSWGNLRLCHDIIQEKNSILLKLKIAFDIARGLNSLYLHSGIEFIHQEINSKNIFIYSVDTKSVSSIQSIHAKVGGFRNMVINSSYSQKKIINYQYSAPEIVNKSSFTNKIDIYSFGILFWEILTGKIPFPKLMDENIDDFPLSLDFIPDDTPLCIIQIIKDCCRFNPNERPSFIRIISILSIILQYNILDEAEIQNRVPSVECENEIKQKIISCDINTHCFSNFQILQSENDKIVMNCKLNLDKKCYDSTLKLITISDTNKMNEFNILSQIQQHPNIICFYGSFQSYLMDKELKNLLHSKFDCDKEIQFYILKKYEKSLESLVCNLDENQILKYLIQLSSCLLFLYENNIVHLNISLSNLMISEDDDLIIVDFGVAQKMDSENGEVQFEQTHSLTTNDLYLSPEILSAKLEQRNLPCKLQHSWELGMTMFQLFTKAQVPFKNYDSSFSENSIDLSNVPLKFQNLISNLLCISQDRISIFEANKVLLTIQEIF